MAPQSAAGMEFVYPMPAWRERVYSPDVIGRFPIGWAVLAMVCGCVCAIFAILAALVRYRSFFAKAAAVSSSSSAAAVAAAAAAAAAAARPWGAPSPHGLPFRFFEFVGVGTLVGCVVPLVWSVDNDAAVCARTSRLWLWTAAMHAGLVMHMDPLVAACICMAKVTP